MAEEETQATDDLDKEIRPTLLNPQYRRMIIATGIVIVLLALTYFAGNVRTNRAKVDTFRSATNALATALRQDLLDANSQRSEAGRDRLEPLITEIAKAGEYRVVTLTDEHGLVLASTDKSIEGEKIEIEDFSLTDAEVNKSKAGYTSNAPIKVGGNAIGFLIIDRDN